jgi:hypothetical protein
LSPLRQAIQQSLDHAGAASGKRHANLEAAAFARACSSTSP